MKINYNGQSELKSAGMKYLHHVCQIAPLDVRLGDSLEVTWDIFIRCYTNGKMTSEEPLKTSVKISGIAMVIRYIEVIWRPGGGTINVHDEKWSLP